MSMSPTMFPISDELKEAADKYAAALGISRAALFREAIAEKIGFDLKSVPSGAGRPQKYATPEDRKAHQKAVNKAKKSMTDRLIELYNKGEREEDIKALAQSIANKEWELPEGTPMPVASATEDLDDEEGLDDE